MRTASKILVFRTGLIITVCLVLGVITVLVIRRPGVPDLPPPVSVSNTVAAAPASRFIPSQPPAPVALVLAPPPAALSNSPAVLAITGDPHRKVDYTHFRDALRALTRDLGPEDVDALMRFLERKAGDQAIMSPIAFNGIKNDVLDVLLLQDTLPDGIGTLLVKMYRDRTYDDMWRDYCVQFMSAYYEVKWPVGVAGQGSGRHVSGADKERKSIETALRGALNETSTTIAGTALLGLDSLSRRYDNIDREDIGRAAMDLLGNPSVGEPARITAFAVAASLQLAEALPEARAIAQTGETIPLQMAAIALIGQLGEPEDQDLLASLAWQENPRIKRIVAAALESLRKRKV